MIAEKAEIIKFLKIGAIFIVLFIFCDRVLGYGLQWLYEKGENKQQYSINRANADVIILGSSRAHHHYDAKLLQDSMKTTCLNLGFDGMSIYFHTILLNTYLKTHQPKIVIYDISPYADICDRDNRWGKEHMELLFPLASKNKYLQSEIIRKADLQGMVGLNISTYCYNSKLLDILKNFNKHYDTSLNGYSPLYKTSKSPSPQKTPHSKFVIDIDKLSCLKEMITSCQQRDIRFILISSPSMNIEDVALIDTLQKFITPFQIPYFNFFSADPFSNDHTYFADRTHLNDKGAKEFSKMIWTICLKKNHNYNLMQEHFIK